MSEKKNSSRTDGPPTTSSSDFSKCEPRLIKEYRKSDITRDILVTLDTTSAQNLISTIESCDARAKLHPQLATSEQSQVEQAKNSEEVQQDNTSVPETQKARPRLRQTDQLSVSDNSRMLTKRHLKKLFSISPERQVPRYSGSDVRDLRSLIRISQSALALLLNTSEATVRAWEFGTKKPNGTSCKLLHLLETRGIRELL